MLNVIEIERVANEAIRAADAHGRRRGRRGRRGPMNLASSVKQFRAQVAERVEARRLYSEEEIVGLGIPAATVRAGILSGELEGEPDGDGIGGQVYRGSAILEWIRVAGIDEATPKAQTTNTTATPTGAAKPKPERKRVMSKREAVVGRARREFRDGADRGLGITSERAYLDMVLSDAGLPVLIDSEVSMMNIACDAPGTHIRRPAFVA